MVFQEFREFLRSAEEVGEVKRVKGGDCNLEIGTLAELVAEKNGPLLLFEDLKDFGVDFRLAVNCYRRLRRFVLALGLPLESGSIDVVQYWRKILRENTSIQPRIVNNAPLRENFLTDEEIDLTTIPAPRWHELDGGNYLGTGAVTIIRDPEQGWVNAGIYRLQLHDRKTIGVYCDVGHHGGLIMKKYWARGENAPVAVAFGVCPAVFIGSYAMLPWGRSEFEMAGQLMGEPLEVIMGELTGLPIPATSEIAFEGEIPPPEIDSRMEGPFGEFLGYYASGRRPEPVIRIKSMMHRDDPIIQCEPPLIPPNGDHLAVPVQRVAPLWDSLERSGVQGVVGIHAPRETGTGLMVVVSIRQLYPGHAKQVAQAASALSRPVCRFVVVVDEDVDPTHLDEVMWAICTRCDLETSIEITKGTTTTNLDPLVSSERKLKGDLTTSRGIINACRPYHQFKDFPPVNRASKDLRSKVYTKWQSLFEPTVD